MHAQGTQRRTVSGHVYRQRRKKGPVFYWKIRLPNGGEERKAIGPVWTGTGRTPGGFFTERSAKAALEARLTDLRRGVGIPARTGATFKDAAEHWFTSRDQEMEWKPSTRRDYRSALDRHLLPAFGHFRLDEVTSEKIESWRTAGMNAAKEKKLTRRTAAKLTTMLFSIFEAARKPYGILVNPVRDVDRIRIKYDAGDYDFYTVEEVFALVRAAETVPPTADESVPAADKKAAAKQDGAIYLTAAFTGLRLGEVLALRVKDVDFPNSVVRVMGSVDIKEGIGTPKSGKGRSVPMAEPVAQRLAQHLKRDHFTGPDDPVFPGETGRYLDGSALRRRFKAAQTRAKLRPLRFHDLRHTFGSLAVTQSESIRELQEWMGHADARTTHRYVHYKSRTGEAARLSKAFQVEVPDGVEATEVEEQTGS
jgi:integrase